MRYVFGFVVVLTLGTLCIMGRREEEARIPCEYSTPQTALRRITTA